jgi:hypothetical protein
MVKVKCQHSGIEFEAATARTKQHPLVAEIKNDSTKKGNYREVNQALANVAKAGGYSTIEEYMSMVKADLKSQDAKADEAAAKRREFAKEEEARKEALRQKREEQNAVLKANGYKWTKDEVGTEGAAAYGGGSGEFSHYAWTLWSPDNRVVTVEQAMDEIVRGADVVKAEKIAKAAQERIEHETQEQAKHEEAAKVSAQEQIYKAIEKEVRKLAQVEHFSFKRSEFERVADFRPGLYGTSYEILKGEINGVTCYVVAQYGDMDWNDYYCADPEAAGLTVKQKAATGRWF